MTTVSLRPDGTQSYVGSPTIVGAATHHGAVSDNTDASYVATTSNITFILGDLNLPPLAYITQVSGRLRWSHNYAGTQPVQFRLKDTGVGANAFTNDLSPQGAANVVHLSGFPAKFTNSSGGPWREIDVDQLLIELNAESNSSVEFRFYEVYVDVTYNEAPVVVVTGPAEGSSVTTTTRPTITWTYSDPEGSPQERYYVKIYSSAQYNAGGFHPNTATPTWYSGEVFSSATSITVPIDLANNTTYRAYVAVADAGSNGRVSNWDNNTFTISVTAPPAPNLIVDPIEAIGTDGPKIMLQITRASSATPTTYMQIEYSDDDGTTWKLHRMGNIQNIPDGSTFTFYDYETPSEKVRKYRAKAIRTV